MERNEKVAYYCSELGKSRSNDPHVKRDINDNSYNIVSNNNISNNNNNNNVIGKIINDSKEKHDDTMMARAHQQDIQSSSNDNPSRLINRFQSIQVDSQQMPSEDQKQHQQQQQQQQPAQRQFANNQILTNTRQSVNASSSSSSSSSTSQPQYLISNSIVHHSTNLTPHHFNQINNNTPFQNQIHPVSYHINSNHHLYQANFQQQQQQQQQQHQSPNRNPLFQHHKSPSLGEEGHPIKLQNQVIFHDNKHQAGESEVQRRQSSNQHQVAHNEQFGITSSQSLTQSEFNRLRRKPDHLGPTSEVGLESLNLDFEAMLMNDGQNIMNRDEQAVYRHLHSNSGQNIDKLLRNIVNQQNSENSCENQINSASDMTSSTGLARSIGGPETSGPNRDPLYMVYNRSEDNIYEEIDLRTMNRLQAEYPVDTISLHSDTWKKKNAKKFLGASFTRWFSTRKKSTNSQNSDQEENPYTDSKSTKRPRLITLPETVPDNLTPEKLKRRLIVGSIVDSENSYTNSLYRLIYEYKKPLEESDPPILSSNKIGIIFFCLDQILQFHTIFGLALSHHVQEWDEKEMIGSVFTFKPMVLDIYSGFINNFSNAMETARRASKSKAFAQFLHDKSVTSTDRLSFFGSMVKPVQRFPQFILLLSDLLKHTPANHPDRMPLQRALTELESLADRLNERKRDAERHFAVKQLLKDHLNESSAHSQRYLLRQDDTCLLDLDTSTNTVLKSKNRKMYLLNDMLICVSTPSNRLKFAVPLSDITIVESITPAITEMLAHSNFKNLNDNFASTSNDCTIERMECERQSLVHDLELMMRIASLVASLRFQYNGLNPAVPEQICLGIRDEIRKKEFQMTLIDRSCLQLCIQSKNHKDKDNLLVQFSSPESKRDWLIDVRLTRLALDRANNPGWENVAENPPPTHQASLCSIGQRVPLFVKSLAIFKSDQSHLTCAIHYYLRQAPYVGENPTGVLWICNVSVGASSLGALATNGPEISLIHSYELSDSHVTCLESVGSTLWIGLRQGRIIVIDANSPGEWVQFASLDVQNEVTCIKYFGHFVYVGLINGIVAVFDAINFDKPFLIQLSQVPVTCLLPVNDEVFACSLNRVWRIKETNIVDSFTVQSDNIIPLGEEPRPNLLAHCGSGLWVSLIDSPIVKLYHAETLKHLVDINVGRSIRRVLNDFQDEIKIVVTSMMTTRGLLWIGTNVGTIATLALPRLQGVPLASGNINVALHRFLGPVNILLNLSAGSECIPALPTNRQNQQIKTNNMIKNEDAEAIYGQYADLMNVGDYISSNRKSGGSLGEGAEKVGWDFPKVSVSAMNISDDSVSNASSGAIYQDGVPRGLRQVHNKAIISNASAMGTAGGMSNQAQKLNQQAVQNQMMVNSNSSGLGQTLQTSQMSENNHVYDKSQTQSLTYHHGSLNQVPPITQNMSSDLTNDHLQQHRQNPMLSASQTQLSSKVVDPSNPPADYGSQSGKGNGKLYDQPAQLIHQQQQIHQSRQALNQMDNGMLSNMQQPPTSNYEVVSKSKGIANKTVLVLAGGNGYQRMALGDNKPFSEHAHCIIWEYKA